MAPTLIPITHPYVIAKRAGADFSATHEFVTREQAEGFFHTIMGCPGVSRSDYRLWVYTDNFNFLDITPIERPPHPVDS